MIFKIIKRISILLATLVCLFGIILLYFTLTTYNPEERQEISNLTKNPAFAEGSPGELTLLTWNIGYGGIGKKADSYFEGGKMGVPKYQKNVEKNLLAMKKVFKENPADIYFIQEVDQESSRTFYINEVKEIIDVFPDYYSWFAHKF